MSDDKLILTPDRRLRVFISSTIGELADERRAASAAVERLRMHPILFELGARPHPPRDLYRAYLAQSDIFIGIYWKSYGWVAPEMDISGIEDEFLLSEGMPRLIYVKDPAPDREPGLKDLLDRVAGSDVSYRKFAGAAELERLVRDDLAILLTERFETSREGDEDPLRGAGLKTRVPATANRLVGRAREIDEIAGLLRGKVRLLSLTGPGGVGKSRLAIEVGNSLKESFADGAHLVMLETLKRAEEVPNEIAASLGLGEMIGSAEPTDLLLRSLADREVLLILDNFEQVLDAGPFISELLTHCPKVKVLATSRTVLRLRGEQEYPLTPLAVPARGDEPVSEAVELFLVRARRSPVIETREQREAVAEICRRLDGLPLAIELAAARTSILSPVNILERLDDRFDLLRTKYGDLPERQQTMRGAIAWSVELLDDQDQEFFYNLAIFSGGLTLAAAEEIYDPDGSSSAIDRLQSLVENSLVQARGEGSEARFRMLESIRQFAAEELRVSGLRDELALRHADYYLRFVLESHQGLRSEHQVATLDRIQADEDNVRIALDHLIDIGRAEDVCDAGWTVWPFWWVRARLTDGRRIMHRVLTTDSELSPLGRARARAGYGTMCLFIGDHGEAVFSLAAAADELRALGNKEGLGLCQAALGIVSSVTEGPEAALARLREAEQLLREVGDDYALILALNSLCWMLMALDIPTDDDSIFEETVALTERVGSMVDLGMAVGNYGRRRAETDRAEGIGMLRRSLLLMVESDMRSGASFMVDSIAELAELEGEAERATHLYGFAASLRDAVGALPIPALEVRRARYHALLEQRLGAKKVAEGLQLGAAYRYEEGIREALNVTQILLDELGSPAAAAMREDLPSGR